MKTKWQDGIEFSDFLSPTYNVKWAKWFNNRSYFFGVSGDSGEGAGDRGWMEGGCDVCTNSFLKGCILGVGGLDVGDGGLWCVSVCRKCKHRAAPSDGSHDCPPAAAPAQ